MAHTNLFDAYIMVDWSAAAVPTKGKDSIWIACVQRLADGALRRTVLENPTTRAAATHRLGDLIARLADEGARVLVGFDFPFGYPRGTGAALGHDGLVWRRIWSDIDAALEDAPNNANNRFDVGEQLNERLSGEAFPFWGHAGDRERPFLLRRGRRPHDAHDLPERRLCELRVKSTQPVWKLAYTGSVGSQALTGIPRVWELRTDPRLAFRSAIWPFETGLAPATDVPIVFAEIYPSIVAPETIPDHPKDAGQVSAMAKALAQWDQDDTLPTLFEGDPALTPEERNQVMLEEAWILGVTNKPQEAKTAPRYDYIRDPAAIYRESERMIRAVTDLSGIPEDLRGVAIRLVHTTGRPETMATLAASDGAVPLGLDALKSGAPVLCDVEMLAKGIIRSRLPKDNDVLCTLGLGGVEALAQRLGTTRSAAAVELWEPWIDGAVVAIGNAPTALFHLLERIGDGWPKPALILGFPVGFVGAAESKQALAESGLPYICLHGREGGSALAAAAVNALSRGLSS